MQFIFSFLLKDEPKQTTSTSIIYYTYRTTMKISYPHFCETKVLKILLLVTVIFLIPMLSIAQYTHQTWKQYKNEVYFGGGTSSYLGDLGGGSGAGQQHSLADLNIEGTQYTFSGGLKTKLSEMISFRADFTYGSAQGADSLTENAGRASRNLSFRTTFISVSPLVEVFILSEKYGRRASPISAYVASGIRFVYYEPKALHDGVWYNLRPLGTEGQTIGQYNPYSKFTIGLPFIIGAKYKLPTRRSSKAGAWTIAFEASGTWLMTDYFDDVSSTYANPEGIRESSGEIGVILADRRLTPSQGTEGGVRGNPQSNDWYGTLQFIVGKKIYKRSGKKRRVPNRGSYF